MADRKPVILKCFRSNPIRDSGQGYPRMTKKAESVLRGGKKYVIKDFLCLNLRQPLNICFKVRLVLK